MNAKDFIKKWNVAFEDKEQEDEFAKEMKADLDRYANHKTEQLQKEVEGLKGGNKERLDKFNQAMKDHLKERDSVQPTKEPTEVKCDKCKQDITFIGFCTNCDDI